MSTERELRGALNRIDDRGYKAYKDLQGKYGLKGFTLFIDYVQGDPFASPSRLRVRVDQEKAGFYPELYHNQARRRALEDFLTRCFADRIDHVSRRSGSSRGSGKSGLITIDRGGQEILERTSMVVNRSYVEARFSVGLPARGRTVLGREAEEMLCRELPEIVRGSLYLQAVDREKMRAHLEVAEDQEHLRRLLAEKRWVAFVADGSILPRRSGTSDLPMDSSSARAFSSPPEMEATVKLPHRGEVRGMAVPEGVTLIVGGGYHGKSTLLRALERGVYNHIPGDGRHYLVSREDAVKIRAEDGRRVAGVNISPFINNLPRDVDTNFFNSDDASGSTSQAANIMEALEIGTSLLFLDEDTSATNFMIRDRRMQSLVAKHKEPITPFIDKVKLLHRKEGVSTVMVVGGSGDYFDVADTVIMMDEYAPREVTGEARRIAREMGTGRIGEGGDSFGGVTPRAVLPRGLDPQKGKKVKISARGLYTIQYGAQNISLSFVEQLVDYSQTRAIGDIIYYLYRKGHFNGRATLREAVEKVLSVVKKEGLEALSPYRDRHPGEMALPRAYEVAAAINRMPYLQVRRG